MKLSDAIMLGSTGFHMKRGTLFDGKGGACALGMGLAASGCEVIIDFEGDISSVIAQWPWTAKSCGVMPCGCLPKYYGYVQAIAHIFDRHVAGLFPTWSIEKLVDWIRSIEPDEAVSTQTEGRDPVCTEPVEMDCRK